MINYEYEEFDLDVHCKQFTKLLIPVKILFHFYKETYFASDDFMLSFNT